MNTASGLSSQESTGRTWTWIALGAASGLTVGVIARLWMRWISTDPEFTWAGTIAILGGFTVFGAVQAGVGAHRRRGRSRRRTTIVRALAGLLSMGIFGAAGAVMFPTVVFGGLAAWRRDWWPAARVVSALAALPLAVITAGDIVDDFGWRIGTVARLTVFALIYVVVVAATRPTLAPLADGWRLNRIVAWTIGVWVVSVLVLSIVFRDQLFV